MVTKVKTALTQKAYLVLATAMIAFLHLIPTPVTTHFKAIIYTNAFFANIPKIALTLIFCLTAKIASIVSAA